ncbi:MAG: hypothetical protein U1A77_14595 [Pirellulales bacterium]
MKTWFSDRASENLVSSLQNLFTSSVSPLVVAALVLLGSAGRTFAVDLKAGDRVVTVQAGVELGFKDKPVKVLDRGAEIVLSEVRDPWIGGTAEIDGEKHTGWVHKREVRRAAVEVKPLPEVTDEASAVVALGKYQVTVEKDDEGHVQVVEATDTGLPDAALAWLAHFPKLNVVALGGTAVTDEGLKSLAALKTIEMLYLDRTEVSDAGLEHLAGLENLVVLVLERSRVTGAGLKTLAPLVELRTLNLAWCPIKDDELEACLKFENLEVATLNKSGINGEGLVHLRPLKKLRVLNISDNPVDEENLLHLQGAPTLKMLYVRGFKTTDATIQSLKDTLISCAVYR